MTSVTRQFSRPDSFFGAAIERLGIGVAVQRMTVIGTSATFALQDPLKGAVRELFDVAFIPGGCVPMGVGLGHPEMRILITFDGARLSAKRKRRSEEDWFEISGDVRHRADTWRRSLRRDA